MPKMEYYSKCGVCGSEFRLTDFRGTYLNTGGAPDDKGHIFTAQVSLSEFEERHQKCLSPPKRPALRIGCE